MADSGAAGSEPDDTGCSAAGGGGGDEVGGDGPMSCAVSPAGSMNSPTMSNCSLDKFMEALDTLSPDQQMHLGKRQVGCQLVISGVRTDSSYVTCERN